MPEAMDVRGAGWHEKGEEISRCQILEVPLATLRSIPSERIEGRKYSE